MKARARSLVPVICLVAASVLLGGCLERKLKPLNPCLVSGVVAEIAVNNVDKVDLLFMVDNSNSMREEQEQLREQFPKLIQTLTTGVRSNGEPFPPARDLHLGVVSSDMGLFGVPGADGLGCGKNGARGDDGVMLNTPSPDVGGCMPPYPRFLEYIADMHDPQQTAVDFGCIATLGTGGCGYEQQLEAGLKALWPTVDPMPLGAPNPNCPDTNNRICFLGDTPGHGDGDNAGFLRSDPTVGLSLIAIIMVSDEEDCSSGDTSHFLPNPPEGHPLAGQPPNLRCFYNPQNLYTVDRYVQGFKALRPDNENLVIFAAIVGVPEDLVTPEAYAAVNWDDENARNAFYDNILNDPRMIETVDESTITPQGGGNLQPSCRSFNDDRSERTKAYPPRRFVQVAKGFGANGTVHSICENDFGPAIDAIIDVIARQLGAVCLPRPLVRDSNGLVGCNVVWELPPPGVGPAETPRECGAPGYEFLLPPGPGRANRSASGGQVCRVAQMAVVGPVDNRMIIPADNDGQMYDQGWYYDDFSEAVQTECTGETKQRVAFHGPNAKPPTGVTVKLECLNETQSLPQTRTDLAATPQPKVGDSCEEGGDAACIIRLANGDQDTSMFCHPKLNVCVQGCSTSTECPDAWVCDNRDVTLAETAVAGNGRAYCVNPTCGASD